MPESTPKAAKATKPAKATARKPRKDAVLEAAVDIAREAAESVASPESVGDHVGTVVEGERVLTHLFASLDPGYRGWNWAVTVSRIPRSKKATVNEVDLIPGEGSLLAPPWVPWEERLQPSDVGRDDVLPYIQDDPRLEPGFTDTSEDPDEPIIRELGLGRARVLSAEGHDEAATRWYKDGSHGPARGRVPKNPCSTCGFLVKMTGSMRTMFGVCANEWSPDDGKVVSMDHTCGAHSETDVPGAGPEWPVRESRINDFRIETEALPAVD